MANTIYANEIIANKVEDILSTHLDMNSFLTVDNSLAEAAGMKKIIHTYTASGNVEDLAMGAGNTGDIEVSYTATPYTVGTTQGRFAYYDEEEMADPMVVDAGIKGLAQTMTNDLTAKAITELGKATLTHTIPSTGLDFNTIVDAIAKYPYEDESGLFLLINPAMNASLRKNLGDSLKYSEGFARTGYIGSVCGVPVFVSKAVPANTAFLATKEAVTCFVKKGSEVEQDRDANTRKTTVYSRKVMVVALTDATRVIKLTSAGK